MATSSNQRFFSCSTCENELDFESKTLPCLHSICKNCLEKEIQGSTNANGHCPECQDIFTIEQLTLSTVLVNSLKNRQLELNNLKCNLCLENGNDSMATNWCHDCAEFLCKHCNQCHQKYNRKHNSVELDENGKEEIRKSTKTDFCLMHHQMKECYCNKCNMCSCNTCYSQHLKNSPQCPSRPISVGEEASKKINIEGPTLIQEISDLERNLKEMNKKCQTFTEDLDKQCDSKCEDIWLNFEEIIEELRGKMHEMCEDLRNLKNSQVKKWRQLIEENKKMIKKFEIWRINLEHLLENNEVKKTDIVCGVELVRTKLASSSSSSSSSDPHPQRKIMEPVRKFELGVTYSNYYSDFLHGIKNQMIGSGYVNSSEKSIQLENEWILPGSNSIRVIGSIVVSEEDSHIFLSDLNNQSIIELNESGEMIFEFPLKTIEGIKHIFPYEMVFISPEILVLNCRVWWRGVREYKLIFFKRQKFFPFLKKEKIIDTKKENLNFSVCQLKERILICDCDNFKIDFYTNFLQESGGSVGGDPLIRADPSTGNFWGAKINNSEIFCFNEEGIKLKSFKIEEIILDFFLNEFGEIYFSNQNGIFRFFPEKKLVKNLHKFQKNLQNYPIFFVFREKMFFFLQIEGKYLIKIFKFSD